MSTTLYVYTRPVSVTSVSKEMSDNIFLASNSDLARAVMMYNSKKRVSRRQSKANAVIYNQLFENGKILTQLGIRVLECVSRETCRVTHNGIESIISISNVVSEAEAIASAGSAAAETVEEAEAAEEGLDHAAEQGMQEERGDAATVAMLAEAKKQAQASTQVSLSPLAASAVVVAEEAPVADVSDAGTKEAATTTAPGIIVTSDKYASANTMQEQHEEAMKEAAARSSDEYSQTGKRGETITIDEAGSLSQTSQVISRSGQRPRSIQVKRKNDEKNEQDMRLQKRKISGPFHSMNEATCRNTRSEWAYENSLN